MVETVEVDLVDLKIVVEVDIPDTKKIWEKKTFALFKAMRIIEKELGLKDCGGIEINEN